MPYDSNNPDTSFDFGRVDSPELISDCDYVFVFKEKKEPFLKRIFQKRKNATKLLSDGKNPNSKNKEAKLMRNKYHVEESIDEGERTKRTLQPGDESR